MPRKKLDRKDWRTLDINEWNTVTVYAMIVDLNTERFDVEKYVPLRGFGYERGVIKRNLDTYGAAAVKEVIEIAFDEYRPTTQYPQLTAGFLLTYMLSRIMPRVLAEMETAKRRQAAESEAPSISELVDWL